MTKQAELIKAALRVELEKCGSSIEEFESMLTQPAQEKTGAPNWLIDPGHLFSAGSTLANAAALTAAGLGAAGGYGLYRAYKGAKDTQEQGEKQMQEKQQYLDAIRSLQDAQKSDKHDAF